jgi:hypothetical protein
VSARRKYVLSNGVVEVKPERMMNQRKRRETARRTRPARPRGASATGQLSVGKAIQMSQERR